MLTHLPGASSYPAGEQALKVPLPAATGRAAESCQLPRACQRDRVRDMLSGLDDLVLGSELPEAEAERALCGVLGQAKCAEYV